MFSIGFSRVIWLVVCFAFFAIHSNLCSQEKQNKQRSKINITMIASEDGFSDLQISVINTFKKVLKENGLFSEMDNNIELLLKVKKTDDADKIILSVVEMQVLPREAVEVGKKAEIFYSLLDETKKENLSEEGKFIREYVSAEYLKQYRMIWKDNLEVIDIDEIENMSQRIAKKYL